MDKTSVECLSDQSEIPKKDGAVLLEISEVMICLDHSEYFFSGNLTENYYVLIT